MQKSIKINDSQSIELNASLGWLFKYRTQFGRDVLPDLMPLLEAVLEIGINLLPVAGKELTKESVTDALNDTDVIEAIATLSGMETTTIIQIVWALNKNADKNTPDIETWLEQFEVFPLDEIIPEVIKLIATSSISTKNSNRLLKRIKKNTK